MAERRMFAKTIIDSDAFLDMPMSARLLYYDLGMRADDDGFVNSPKKIQRVVGASDDDMKLLIAKKFIIPFESGVVVVKHWKINNFIRSDRYIETKYKVEKSMLELDENNSYRLTTGIPHGSQLVGERDTQVRLGKGSLSKESIIIMSSDEEQYIKELEKIDNYPLDRQKDIEYYHVLQERFPTVDLVSMIQDYAAYKLDHPLVEKDNPRSQINTQCKKCVEWGKCLKDKPRKEGMTAWGTQRVD